MRKIVCVLAVLMVFTLLAVDAGAQHVAWEIKFHGDLGKIKNEINKFTQDGYVPVGLSLSEGGFYILYIKTELLTITAWRLSSYDNVEALKSGLTSSMESGYVPSGVSYTSDKFYVLYIKPQHETATAWRIVSADMNMDNVQASIQEWAKEWYFPVGITSYGGKYYTLMIKTKQTDIKSWMIRWYEPNSQALQAGINKAIEEGYVPWGFNYLGSQVHVLYAGLVPYKE